MEIIKESTIREQVKELIQESKDAREEILAQLNLGKEAYNLGEWVTLKTYAEKFEIDVHVLYNWIRRGKVPKENIVTVEELNGLKLIKAIPYGE